VSNEEQEEEEDGYDSATVSYDNKYDNDEIDLTYDNSIEATGGLSTDSSHQTDLIDISSGEFLYF